MKIVQIGSNKGNDDLSNYLFQNYEELQFGLFVEANNFHIEELTKCYKRYSNVHIENVAVKSPNHKEDTLEIYYHTDEHPHYSMASSNIESIEWHMTWCPHLQQGGVIKSFTVPCITIDQLFEKYSITEIDWLCLDVETLEPEILLTTNWDKYKIKRIEFEKIHLGCYKNAIENMLYGMGYKNVPSLHEYDWAFEKIQPQCLDLKEKLKNLPPVHYISVNYCHERREILHQKFAQFGIENITGHIFQKYDDSQHEIISDYIDHLSIGSRGPVTSHLKAIKEWYDNTQEEIAFFCEDDLSMDLVQYWNFTWDDFYNSLPDDWEIVQLAWLRYEFYSFKIGFRNRCWCDWSGCAYIIKREFAKKLIDTYYYDGKFHLDVQGTDVHLRPDWAKIPVIESIIFSPLGKVYGAPLFTEDLSFLPSYLDPNTEEGKKQPIHEAHYESYDNNLNWWRNVGSKQTIRDFMRQ
jgi:FkbM family methyltransferase